MYWGQFAIGLAAASGLSYTLYQADRSLGTAIAAGVLAYLVVRWLWAWGARTRHWYRRRSRYSELCPRCRRSRYRLAGDWILTCHKCGWAAGWPGVRWLTRSVPAIQLWRTVVGPTAVVAVVVGVLVLSGATAGVTADAVTGADVGISPGVLSPGTPEPAVNETALEIQVLRSTNEYRVQHGVAPVTADARLSELARQHARDMAVHDYIGHAGPNGTRAPERYSGACSYADSPFLHGENVHGAWYRRTFSAWPNGDETYLGNETAVARYLVGGWMKSDGHRRNMLHSGWDELGVGVVVRDDGAVFAVQVFC